jgi:hypothetical protein
MGFSTESKKIVLQERGWTFGYDRSASSGLCFWAQAPSGYANCIGLNRVHMATSEAIIEFAWEQSLNNGILKSN